MSKHREWSPGIIKAAKLNVIVMPNDEILCGGKHIGWLNDKLPSWFDPNKRLTDYVEVADQCGNCGGDRPNDADYCPECGAP